MTAELILHIGDCKSGSTAIQSVLQRGTWRLDGAPQSRLAYAVAGRRGTLNHHVLSNALFMPEATQNRDVAWPRLGQELRQSPAQSLIVSSERFEFADPVQVHAALQAHLPEALERLRIIAYVRPHADRLLSGYSQNIKQGIFTGTLSEFADMVAEKRRMVFCDRLLDWRRVFGDAAVTIRPMIRETLQGGCVVQDFLGFCVNDPGITPVVETIPVTNTALDTAGVALLTEVWKRTRRNNPAPNRQRDLLLERYAARVEQERAMGGEKLRLDRETARKLPAMFAEDAARCDELVFGAPTMAPRLDQALAAMDDLPERASEAFDPRITDACATQVMIWMDVTETLLTQQAQAFQRRQTNGQAAPAAAQRRPTMFGG